MADDDQKKRAAVRLATAKTDLADEALKSFARVVEGKWKALCVKGSTMRMWFLIVNHRLDFSYAFGESSDPAPVDPVLLGEFIIRAMEQFKKEHVPPEPYTVTRIDGRKVTYDRHVEIRWGDGVVATSFSLTNPVFLKSLDAVVYDLRKNAPKKAVN